MIWDKNEIQMTCIHTLVMCYSLLLINHTTPIPVSVKPAKVMIQVCYVNSAPVKTSDSLWGYSQKTWFELILQIFEYEKKHKYHYIFTNIPWDHGECQFLIVKSPKSTSWWYDSCWKHLISIHKLYLKLMAVQHGSTAGVQLRTLKFAKVNVNHRHPKVCCLLG